MLTTSDHNRDKAGLTYIYPVLSRRSGGLSVGVNLNTNNACNWRCIYCQVPNLIRGSAPTVNLEQLAQELRSFLGDVIHGNFFDREEVSDEFRVIKDIAISGNGEPTTAREFDQVVNVIELILKEYGLLGSVKCVLITNGSMVNKVHVKKGLQKLAEMNGEIWFKVDSATLIGIAKINQVKGSNTSTLKRLKIAAELCPTLIQTCVFSYKNKTPDDTETNAYLNLLKTVVSRKIPIKGVLLYGIERQSLQPEAKIINKVPEAWLQELALQIKALSIYVSVSA
ncbi:MAG: radical SAM protein [Gammaproteobacteria bacterium]|jgi:wyosine [tRNA(Phe)-imidazoG37] synthetase (radical SAM superfamily)|nr:radical SAM protein [Gammaproteobacteria bacterium]